MLAVVICDDLVKVNRQVEALKIMLEDTNLPVKDRDIFENTVVQLKAHKAELERRNENE